MTSNDLVLPEASRALEHARGQHHAVLITHRHDGGLQSSPIAVVTGDNNRLWVSTTSGSAKARNLRRDARVSLCLVPDAWFGAWSHVDGTAVVRPLPDSLELLVEYYRRIAGEHEDWDDYRAAMIREQRVLLEIAIERVAGPA